MVPADRTVPSGAMVEMVASSRPVTTAVPSGRKPRPHGTSRPVATVLTISSPSAGEPPDAGGETWALGASVLLDTGVVLGIAVLFDSAVLPGARIVVASGGGVVPPFEQAASVRSRTEPIRIGRRESTPSSMPTGRRAPAEQADQPAAALVPPDEPPLDELLADPDEPDELDEPPPDDPLPDPEVLADFDPPDESDEPEVAAAFFSPPLSPPDFSPELGLSDDPLAGAVLVEAALESVR